MKKIRLFILGGCPYCVRMMRQVDQILDAHPEYRDVPLDIIDEREQRDIARQHDYFFVPAIYLDGEKVYEERALHTDVEQIFKTALEG